MSSEQIEWETYKKFLAWQQFQQNASISQPVFPTPTPAMALPPQPSVGIAPAIPTPPVPRLPTPPAVLTGRPLPTFATLPPNVQQPETPMKDVDTELLNIAASKNEDVRKVKPKEKKRVLPDSDTSLDIFDSTSESESEEKKRIAKKRAKRKEFKAFYKEFKEFKKSKMEAKENEAEKPIPTPTPSPKADDHTPRTSRSRNSNMSTPASSA